MDKKVLVTGGAGFIGSHIVDLLIENNYNVTILDNLDPTTHKEKPKYLSQQSRFVLGDVRDSKLIEELIPRFDYILHEAASVGIVQSNYEIKKFVDNNILGTANILEALTKIKHNVKKLILAGSNTSYGEGIYKCKDCGPFHAELRTQKEIDRYGFEPICPTCQKNTKAIPTPEETELNCNSIYAYSKKNQEETALFIGKTYNIPVTILRYFNVYGPRQSLSNPYTGVAAIFATRLKNNNSPIIYEDGLQTRDFISVRDVAKANLICLKNKSSNYEIFNVGSSKPITIKWLAEFMKEYMKKEVKIKVTNKFRKGDIRHCFADISKIKNKLDFSPKVKFEEGIQEFLSWAEKEESEDKFEKANKELKEKGLI